MSIFNNVLFTQNTKKPLHCFSDEGFYNWISLPAIELEGVCFVYFLSDYNFASNLVKKYIKSLCLS